MAFLTVDDFKSPPALTQAVSEFWNNFANLRHAQLEAWSDVRRYVYATNTEHTINETTDWKNKTTRNKLAWIYDKLRTQYIRNLMPNDNFFRWQADPNTNIPNEIAQRVEDYQKLKVRDKFVKFRHKMAEILDDLILAGNCFATLKYKQKTTVDKQGREKLVFQGAVPVRIPPQDVVFDPTAEDYDETPICWRQTIFMHEFFENVAEDYDEEVVEKLRELYQMKPQELQDWIENEHLLQDGSSYVDMVEGKEIELLQYFGPIYDEDTQEFHKNAHVIVANRMFLLVVRPINNLLGTKPILFSSWRKRPDDLWGQGPLEQIVGLQYRIDHLENMKADGVDFMGMPVILVKGEGIDQEFTWQPGQVWYVPYESEVEIIYPDPKIILFNEDILQYERAMEEYAGVPRETAGFRTPGEKTKFEVAQLLSNANEPFEEKLMAFEDELLEPLLQLMLEINLENATTEELQMLFPEQILVVNEESLNQLQNAVMSGKIYAQGSKHYKQSQTKIQDMMSFLELTGNLPGIAVHVSQFAAAKFFESELGIEDTGVIKFGAQIEEQAGLQMHQQQVQQAMQEEGQQQTNVAQ